MPFPCSAVLSFNNSLLMQNIENGTGVASPFASTDRTIGNSVGQAMHFSLSGLFFLSTAMVSSAHAAPAAEEATAEVAGRMPDRRPAGAPVIKVIVRTPEWHAKALHGVEAPYPERLKFLNDQGNWYTPFISPGMTGPYDLRGWHAAPATVSGA